jgi:hypothetical protein
MEHKPRGRSMRDTTRIYLNVDGPPGRLIIDGPLSLVRELLDAVERSGAKAASPSADDAVARAERQVAEAAS